MNLVSQIKRENEATKIPNEEIILDVLWRVQMKRCDVVLSTSWFYDNFNGTCRYEKHHFLNTTFTNIQRQLSLYCRT